MLIPPVLGLIAAALAYLIVVGLQAWSRQGGRGRRPAFLAAVSSAVVLGLAGPALAAMNETGGFTYRSTYECTFNYIQINNTGGTPRMDSYVQDDTHNYAGGDCDQNVHVSVPPGNLAILQNLYHWNGSQWTVCNAGGWYYNTGSTSILRTGYSFSYPCGGGYYIGDTTGYVWNSQWYGGRIQNGNYIYV